MWADTVNDEAMGWGLFIDSRHPREVGNLDTRRQGRIRGLLCRISVGLYETLSMTEIKLRKRCPVSPVIAHRRKQSCGRRRSCKGTFPEGDAEAMAETRCPELKLQNHAKTVEDVRRDRQIRRGSVKYCLRKLRSVNLPNSRLFEMLSCCFQAQRLPSKPCRRR